MICLRHRSASGDVSNGWEFDARERRILCSMRDGRHVVEFGVYVCSAKRPAVGAHPIVRIDSEAFRVLPERYIVTWPKRIETLVTIRCPISDSVAYGNLVLTNTPATVAAELEAL